MPTSPPLDPHEEDVVRRFERSMVIDYDKWHDGIGYEVELIQEAGPEERAAIESLLVARGIQDWRDVEALAAIDTPRVREMLAKTLRRGGELGTAVLRYAPHVVPDAERTAALVEALRTSQVYGGLTQALLEVEEFHPPEVVEALFRGVLERSGEVAGEFAAMLLFLHGKTEAAYDFELRPFFLRFQDEDRRAMFRELCGKLGVDAEPYLRG